MTTDQPPLPPSLAQLASQLSTSAEVNAALSSTAAAPGPVQRAAVLVLLDHQTDPTVLLTVRSAELTHHAGQVSFPGGGIEAGETPTMAACREAEEEVGLATAAVHVIGELPPSRIDVSRFAVRAVVGWWDGQAHLTANPAEVAAIAHLPVSHLADPDHRFTWLHPRGATGPGFEADDLFIWGFTAFVLDALLTAGSWSQDWDPSDIRPVPPRWRPV